VAFFWCLFFNRLKICGSPVLGKSIGTIFPTAFADFVSLSRFGNSHNISNIFPIICYGGVISDLCCCCCYSVFVIFFLLCVYIVPLDIMVLHTYRTILLLLSRFSLCDPIDGSPPGSPVPGILQARTLEWIAIAFSSA